MAEAPTVNATLSSSCCQFKELFLQFSLTYSLQRWRVAKPLNGRVRQKGIKLTPIDVRPLIDSVKQNNLQADFFFIGVSKYMVTSVHDHWYCARCINTTNPAGEGAIIVQTAAFILVTIYEGSIGAASEAMAATDYLMDQLSNRNL
ncbi:uncharacterized protein LOC131862439 [Cryptomeria japonica]|uniref:uncharacterized protein LOC131862439 n=1 Tax=Cryptomeria japonica TaxID=3369 RepID=UPI0027DAAF63|nr:uncharacterized protein LOC131862439 [Cryptomeria japonica]